MSLGCGLFVNFSQVAYIVKDHPANGKASYRVELVDRTSLNISDEIQVFHLEKALENRMHKYA